MRYLERVGRKDRGVWALIFALMILSAVIDSNVPGYLAIVLVTVRAVILFVESWLLLRRVRRHLRELSRGM